MSKYEKRLKARSLRKSGESIILIAKKLGVSKSSVSLWCNDITLTPEQIEKLVKNKGVAWSSGKRIGSIVNHQKKVRAIKNAEDEGVKIIGRITKRELMLVATALYWSEGSKSDGTSTFLFVNSDPKMVYFMKKYMKDILKVSDEDIMCRIQINQVHSGRIKTVLNFWQNLLKLEKHQIKKPYFVKTNLNKVYANHDEYFGVCRLFIKRGKDQKYKMLGQIKALKSNMSA